MSSILVVQQQDNFIFSVDTAECMGDQNRTYRIHDKKVDKIHKIGKDIVFLSGMDYAIKDTLSFLKTFSSSNYIDELKLYEFLKDRYPLNACKWLKFGLTEIGVQILRIKDNNALFYDLTQNKSFEISTSTVENDSVTIQVAGFDAERIYNNAMQLFSATYLQKGYLKPDNFIRIYQKCYSEPVGGNIRVYRFDKDGCILLKEEALKESGLNYIYKTKEDIQSSYTAHLNGASGVFKGVLEAGEVKGTTIQGSTINGTTINGGSVNGSTINSSGARDGVSYRTKIEDGYISTNGIFLSDSQTQAQTSFLGGSYIATPNLQSSKIGGFGGTSSSSTNAIGTWIFDNIPLVSGDTLISQSNFSSFFNREIKSSLYTDNMTIRSGLIPGQIKFSNGNGVGWDYATSKFNSLEARIAALEGK